MRNVALTFTARGKERILREGGSGDWTVNPLRVSDHVDYVICCQNTNPKRKGNDWGQATHKHGQAFLVGKLLEVISVTEDADKKKRYQFVFSEYAEIEIDDIWGGDRFPVRYLQEKDLPFDVTTLDYKPMPKFKSKERVFSLEEAKKALSNFYDIDKTDVKIML
ncbi:hypothetical protein [Agarivorans gilvus]|uniref:Uncharacterized protein n=1 Tax=Agarivorans gilvus TaxID=680279 RepID=A0ABQ1I2K3_9ALTE|nr:hypothetical protein [Agarivorans gilvus]GGB03935.1 hypothetical protein GCM10007414_16560 [Agarivorans gilvus]